MLELERLHVPGHEEVVRCRDDAAGLVACVAIHDTTLGPAVGGTRMLPYRTDDEALADALRLSEAMTYKAAAAGLAWGGGKSTIVGDPTVAKPVALLRAFAQVLERLEGRFMTGEDVGTTAEDMQIVGETTRHVIYPHREIDPGWETAFLTAHGVVRGIEASVLEALGSSTLEGVEVAVQGAGKVGSHVVRMLHELGARVLVADTDGARARAAAANGLASVAEPREILETRADVFCPCALGGILDSETIPRLRCRIVAGAANNQLSDESLAGELHTRGILYAPDYVVNAGGLISALYEMGTCDRATVMGMTDEILGRLKAIFDRARQERVSPHEASRLIVRERIDRVRRGFAAPDVGSGA